MAMIDSNRPNGALVRCSRLRVPLGLAGFTALLLFACTNTAVERDGGEESSSVSECSDDSDCATGFCDRNRCAIPAEEYVYGVPCKKAPTLPEGIRDGRIHQCGAYLCIDGLCRSCISDNECLAELGSPACLDHAIKPGLRCGAQR